MWEDEKAGRPTDSPPIATAKKEKDETPGQPSAEFGDVLILDNALKLQPTPTLDPLDPLNWSSAKKHSILAIVMAL
jgi:hypothetical protein